MLSLVAVQSLTPSQGEFMAKWVSVRVAQNLWFKFWQDCRRLPKQVWQRWATTLAIGFVPSAVVTLAITYFARQAQSSWLQAWDEKWLPIVIDALPLTFSSSITWESPGNSIGALVVALVFIGIMVWQSRPLAAATGVAAYGLHAALVWTGWGFWNRERPDLVAGGVAAPALHSFPSGHAIVVIAVYGFLAYLWLRAARSVWERLVVAIAFLLFASRVISARLVLGAHWPSDILAGLLIGVMLLTTLIWAYNRAESALPRQIPSVNLGREDKGPNSR